MLAWREIMGWKLHATSPTATSLTVMCSIFIKKIKYTFTTFYFKFQKCVHAIKQKIKCTFTALYSKFDQMYSRSSKWRRWRLWTTVCLNDAWWKLWNRGYTNSLVGEGCCIVNLGTFNWEVFSLLDLNQTRLFISSQFPNKCSSNHLIMRLQKLYLVWARYTFKFSYHIRKHVLLHSEILSLLYTWVVKQSRT